VSWLRLLAYNLLSMWRHKIPPQRDEVTTSSHGFHVLGGARACVAARMPPARLGALSSLDAFVPR
jgi:hypothetical protein